MADKFKFLQNNHTVNANIVCFYVN